MNKLTATAIAILSVIAATPAHALNVRQQQTTAPDAIPAGGSLALDAHGFCKNVNNPYPSPLLLPARTSIEWQKFREKFEQQSTSCCQPRSLTYTLCAGSPDAETRTETIGYELNGISAQRSKTCTASACNSAGQCNSVSWTSTVVFQCAGSNAANGVAAWNLNTSNPVQPVAPPAEPPPAPQPVPQPQPNPQPQPQPQPQQSARAKFGGYVAAWVRGGTANSNSNSMRWWYRNVVLYTGAGCTGSTICFDTQNGPGVPTLNGYSWEGDTFENLDTFAPDGDVPACYIVNYAGTTLALTTTASAFTRPGLHYGFADYSLSPTLAHPGACTSADYEIYVPKSPVRFH